MRIGVSLGLALGVVASAVVADPASPPAAVSTETPLASLPYSPSLDTTSMDRSVDPCEDLYQYSCGAWIKNNPIPPDQSAWSVYGKLYNDNQRFLWGILADLAGKGAERTAPQQKIGDYFAACMDEAGAEHLDAAPLAPQLKAIEAVQDRKGLAPLLAQLQLADDSPGFFFEFESSQDYEDSQSVIAFARGGGLGLPDRDYYLKPDAKSVKLRSQYRSHVERMFLALGDTPALAKQESAGVLSLETALAKASLTLVQKRDPHQLVHKMPLAELQALTPALDWQAYTAALGLGPVAVVNVTEPAFYRALGVELQRRPLAALKSYLRWHIAHAAAPYLSSRFVNENFDFFSHTLRGTKQLRPRWKRCVALVDGQLGEALGQEFVARTFTPELKAKTLEMTRYIEAAMQGELEGLDWMSAATKQEALVKLHAVVNKIGYPDHWRDYSSVEIRRDDLLGNAQRANGFEARRELDKIGKPLDRGEWDMTPPTVNAYYDPQMNDVNFPAGVLQPPLYDAKLDDAPNYGNTGSTIGHELTHGFDDEGRQFDDKGNLRNWWTKDDAKGFEARAACVVDQYAGYTVIDNIKINSKLTEGEDIADLGGSVLAYIAWKAATYGQTLPDRDGLTPDQRYFVGLAQWDCSSERPESLRVHAATDPHSPGRYRINGVVANMPEFAKAFSCKAGQPMVNPAACRIW